MEFCSFLEIDRSGVWNDLNGSYRISIVKNSFLERIKEIEKVHVLHSDYLSKFLPDFNRTNNNPSTMVSIGAFNIHNAARIYCHQKKIQLITIPAPLANDSFGTNRICYSKMYQSIQGAFPIETIIDLGLLRKLPLSNNLLGIGEFIGLYTSLIDYCYSRDLDVPVDLTNYIVNLIKDVSITYKSIDLLLCKIAINLIFKCLLMRVNDDHQIGCGCDHIMGGFLENQLNIPHGQAVFLGSSISLLLFPDWAKFGLDISELIILGKRNKWISHGIIRKLHSLSFDQFIEKSLLSRPDRPTQLTGVLKTIKGDVWDQFDSLTAYAMKG